jgi:hypothetical protein
VNHKPNLDPIFDLVILPVVLIGGAAALASALASALAPPSTPGATAQRGRR